MIDLPPGASPEEVERLADWAEANALLDEDDVSRDDLIRAFQAGGLIGLDEAFSNDDAEIGRGDDESRSEAAERLAEDVLAECASRAKKLGKAYPLVVENDVLSAEDGAPADAYLFLLLADLGLKYPTLKGLLQPDTHSGMLLEKVVEAALRGIFGRAQRFGWPREEGWPTHINDRVTTLAESLGLKTDGHESKTSSDDNDRTLDVVALMTMPRESAGTLAVLTQCAAGANWKKKTGEPSITAWHNLLHWNCTLVRAVALPWALGNRKGDWSYTRAWQLFNNAMILDRPRLLAGNPDAHLDAAVVPHIRVWCQAASAGIPRADFL